MLDDELPPRPRRRAVTPVALGLAGALVAAGGFIGGVEVQKGQQDASAPSRAAFPAAAAAAGGPGGGLRGAPGGPAPTIGQVANKRGRVLYVKDTAGTTIRVRTTAQSKFTRTSGASVRGIYPGDTVLVQGTKRADGSITATQVRATANGVAGGGGGFGGGGGGPGG